MPWQVVFASFYVFRSSAFILQRVFAKNTDLPNSLPPALAKLLVLTPIGILVGLMIPHHVQWSWWLIFLLSIESIGIGIYGKLGFQASRGLTVAEFQIINQLYIVVVIALGWVVLSEKLNTFQIIGALLLLVSAILAARAPRQANDGIHPSHHLKLIGLTLIGVTTFGIGLIAEKTALRHMDLGAYFIFGFGAQTLVSTFIALPDIKGAVLRQIDKKVLVKSLLWGLAITFGGFTYLYAVVQSNNVSLIVALTAFVLPLSVTAAFLWLKERENMRTLIFAVVLGCLGLIVTAL